MVLRMRTVAVLPVANGATVLNPAFSNIETLPVYM